MPPEQLFKHVRGVRPTSKVTKMDTKKTHSSSEILTELITRYPVLAGSREDIQAACRMLEESFTSGHKLLIVGNGGSAADADHISGELTKSFRFKRRIPYSLRENLISSYGEEGKNLASNLEGGLPVIPLTTFNASLTAFANDTCPQASFAQLVNALGTPGDVFLGITTSGNSENIVLALMLAKAKGIHSVALTGAKGGKCVGLADICIRVPENETFKVQELHLPVYHALCAMIEADMFNGIE